MFYLFIYLFGVIPMLNFVYISHASGRRLTVTPFLRHRNRGGLAYTAVSAAPGQDGAETVAA